MKQSIFIFLIVIQQSAIAQNHYPIFVNELMGKSINEGKSKLPLQLKNISGFQNGNLLLKISKDSLVLYYVSDSYDSMDSMGYVVSVFIKSDSIIRCGGVLLRKILIK